MANIKNYYLLFITDWEKFKNWEYPKIEAEKKVFIKIDDTEISIEKFDEILQRLRRGEI